jgi:hypothetical protein
VEENDWDDEYPAHARTRLVVWSIWHYPRQAVLRRRTVCRMGYTFAQTKYPDMTKLTPVNAHLNIEKGLMQIN